MILTDCTRCKLQWYAERADEPCPRCFTAAKVCLNCAATMDAAAKVIRERDALSLTLDAIRRIVADATSLERDSIGNVPAHQAQVAISAISGVLEGAGS